MANTENIEAKLCAYIDGELDAQGRAEIEKHLASNPQHRGLIEQLAGQRDLLRQLPREEAPEEIIEALQSQMERSVLLGDTEAGEAQTLKMRRWPQVMAAAALVLLTVALGIVIYFVLPRSGLQGEYAIVSAPGAPGAAGATGATSADDATASAADTGAGAGRFERDATAEKTFAGAAAAAGGAREEGKSLPPAELGERTLSKAAPAPLAAAGASPSEMKQVPQDDVFAPGRAGGGEGAVATDDVRAAQGRLADAELAQQLKDAPGGGWKENAMFVVVSTADPAAARSQVTNYLADKKITWDAVAQPMPQPIDVMKQDVNLARRQVTDVQLKTTATAQPEQEQLKGKAAQDGSGGGSGSGSSGAAQRLETSQQAQAVQQQAEQQQPPQQQGQQQGQQSAPAAQAPASPGAQAGVADLGKRADGEREGMMTNVREPDLALNAATQQQEQEKQQVQKQLQQQPIPSPSQVQTAAAPAPPAAARGLIVARMTKQEAEELSSTLSKQTTVQRAQVYEQRPAAAAPSAPQVLFRSRQVDVSATTQPAAAAAPTTTRFRYEDRPLTATGASSGTSGAVAAVPSVIASGGPSPATQETATGTGSAGAVATTQAAEPPTTTTAPAPVPLSYADGTPLDDATTQPAASADERVDVVIVVQDDVLDAAAMPTAAPDAPPNAAAPAPNAPDPEPPATTQPATPREPSP